MVWPLLCSMAKAKRYLLTGDKLNGREAEPVSYTHLTLPTTERV